MEDRISEQDLQIVIEILRNALKYRPLIPKAIVGDDLQALSPEERANEVFSPRVAIHYVGDNGNIPSLFFRLMGAEVNIAEGFFYPIEAVYKFLKEARAFARWMKQSNGVEEEIENIARSIAEDMTLIMIDNFYRRVELMAKSFTAEVIAQWHIQTKQLIVENAAESGITMGKRKNLELENALKEYKSNILIQWQSYNLAEDEQRKLQLSEEYDVVYEHWKNLSRLLGDQDWCQHAKAGKFHDTPDDLLDKLENSDRADGAAVALRLSELALEHAARRVGLIKARASKLIKWQRRRGRKVSGYTSRQLFQFLREGRELMAKLKEVKGDPTQESTPVSVVRDPDSAQVQQAKVFKQKVRAVQDKIGTSSE